MTNPNIIVLSGYGLNSEEETLHAFKYNGFDGNIVHINDLIDAPEQLSNYQALAIPGGFSYGDDTGSGNGFAQKMRLSLMDHLNTFLQRDTLMIGICNGCQILSNLGLVPGQREVAVTYNQTNRYQCRWIDVKINADNQSPWLKDIDTMHIPVAHGEGRFMMSDETLNKLSKNNQVAATYIKADGTPANGEFPHNPNGAIGDVAAITNENGRVLAIMPHPERGMFSWQRDDYDYLKDQAQRNKVDLAEASDGLKPFTNAATYFKA